MVVLLVYFCSQVVLQIHLIFLVTFRKFYKLFESFKQKASSVFSKLWILYFRNFSIVFSKLFPSQDIFVTFEPYREYVYRERG